MEAIQIIINVLSVISILLLVVLGLGIIFGMMNIVNLAHGELILLGALSVYFLSTLGIPPIIAVLLSPIITAAIGFLIERFIIRYLYARPLDAILATWGIALVLRESTRYYLKGETKVIPNPIPGTFELFGYSFSIWRVTVIVIAVIVVLVIAFIFKKSSIGLLINATLQNKELAITNGVNTNMVFSLTFVIGSALAGLAGALIGPLMALFPEMGLMYLVQSFLSVIVGGIGTITGPITGGAIIGATSGGFPYFMSPIVAEIIIFILAIILLRLKPEGLIGQKN